MKNTIVSYITYLFSVCEFFPTQDNSIPRSSDQNQVQTGFQ